jgi:hypothetical protein
VLRDTLFRLGIYTRRSIGEADRGRKSVPVIPIEVNGLRCDVGESHNVAMDLRARVYVEREMSRSRGGRLKLSDEIVKAIFGLFPCDVVVFESDNSDVCRRDRGRPCM